MSAHYHCIDRYHGTVQALIHSNVCSACSFISLLLCAYTARVGQIRPFFGQVRHMHLLLSRGCFGAATMQTLYLAIVMLPLADAVTIFFLNPTVTAVAAWLILREQLSLVVSVG